MASGSFQSSRVANTWAEINWNSSAGNGGSTVNADLAWNSVYGYYFTCYDGYTLTINGNSKSGSGKVWSGAGYSVFLSHSVWVGYTGDKTISISGNINLTGIYSSSIGGNLPNFTLSSNVGLDKIGSVPPDFSMTAPTAQTISEKGATVTLRWNRCNDYSGNAKYRIQVSINGGSYNNVATGIANSTTSYNYAIPAGQGNTYTFRIDASNDIGSNPNWSYSGTVTTNRLNAPAIGNLPTYNPFVTATLNVPLSGGSQTNGGTFRRCADLYHNGTLIASAPYSSTSNNNSSVNISYSTANYLARLGTTAYTGTFRITAWIENANGSRSGYVSKDFTVNINTDGGATPTVGVPTLSGGAMGYPATCFIAGRTNLTVTSATGQLRRAPSGTTLSYSISLTGAGSKSGTPVTFSGLTAGDKTVTVTVTDGRGLRSSATTTCRVQSWALPTVNVTNSSRRIGATTTIDYVYTLSYSPIYSAPGGTQLNGINTQQYALNASTTYTNCTSPLAIANCSNDLAYTINFRCSDKVATTSYTTISRYVGTAAAYISIRPWGVGLGAIPENGYRLDVRGSIMVRGGNINLTASSGASSGIEISGKTPHIDFHYNESTADYTARIIAQSSGTITITPHLAVAGTVTSGEGISKFPNAWMGTIYGGSGTWLGFYSTSYGGNRKCWMGTDGSNNVFSFTGENGIDRFNFNKPVYYNGTDLRKVMFPVGAVYITYNNNNPGNFIGGTWTQFGQGRVLIGQGTGNDGSNSVGFSANATGGKYIKELRAKIGAAHGDISRIAYRPEAAVSNDYSMYITGQGYGNSASTTGTANHTATVVDTGNAHLNMLNPYIVVYFWRRTA